MIYAQWNTLQGSTSIVISYIAMNIAVTIKDAVIVRKYCIKFFEWLPRQSVATQKYSICDHSCCFWKITYLQFYCSWLLSYIICHQLTFLCIVTLSMYIHTMKLFFNQPVINLLLNTFIIRYGSQLSNNIHAVYYMRYILWSKYGFCFDFL